MFRRESFNHETLSAMSDILVVVRKKWEKASDTRECVKLTKTQVVLRVGSKLEQIEHLLEKDLISIGRLLGYNDYAEIVGGQRNVVHKKLDALIRAYEHYLHGIQDALGRLHVIKELLSKVGSLSYDANQFVGSINALNYYFVGHSDKNGSRKGVLFESMASCSVLLAEDAAIIDGLKKFLSKDIKKQEHFLNNVKRRKLLDHRVYKGIDSALHRYGGLFEQYNKHHEFMAKTPMFKDKSFDVNHASALRMKGLLSNSVRIMKHIRDLYGSIRIFLAKTAYQYSLQLKQAKNLDGSSEKVVPLRNVPAYYGEYYRIISKILPVYDRVLELSGKFLSDGSKVDFSEITVAEMHGLSELAVSSFSGLQMNLKLIDDFSEIFNNRILADLLKYKKEDRLLRKEHEILRGLDSHFGKTG